MPSADAIPSLVIMFVVLVLSLSFHEAAHAWTADRLGDPTARHLGRLTLNPIAHIDWIGTVLFPVLAMLSGIPLIGWAKPVPVDAHNLRAPRRDFAVVAAAGPVSNLVLATGAAVLRAFVNILPQAPGVAGVLVSQVLLGAIVMNVLLAVFNMIPVPPLDGGNVAMGVLPAPAAALIARLRPWGFLILYALMLTGVLWQLIRPINDALLQWLL